MAAPNLTTVLVPDSEAVQYYLQLLDRLGSTCVEVRLDAGDGRGKGVFAVRDIKQGGVLWTEEPLACQQHLENQGQAVVCRQCLKYVGSIEQQIAQKLTSIITDLRNAAHGGQPQLPDGEGQADEEGEAVDLEAALQAGERLEQIYAEVGEERLAALASGEARLPLSDRFVLPQPVPCRRTCGAQYCCAACEQRAWDSHHCLLCTANPFVEGAAARAADAAGPSCAGAGPSASPAATAAAGASNGSSREVVHGVEVDRCALRAFYEHARQTNDIFVLAAQVLAQTLLRASELLAAAEPQQQQEQQRPEQAQEAAAGSSCSGDAGAAAGTAAAGTSCRQSAAPPAAAACEAALQRAWRPYALGWKRLWWESVAVPDDVDDEEQFRSQLRELVHDSLTLLQAALTDARFGPLLLVPEVYGAVVGMFELNNLGLNVDTPVEDYFLEVDAMPEGPEKEAVLKVTQPLLDALDSDYATACDATAFLALQSCVNHSCDPNAEAACDASSEVTIVARRDLQAGEEVTMSYIDEALPLRERHAALRDYGFVCRCAKCNADAVAARARKAAKAKKLAAAAAVKRR